jgi:hypothetical protein
MSDGVTQSRRNSVLSMLKNSKGKVIFTYCDLYADDLELELRLARLENLMERRPLLLNR